MTEGNLPKVVRVKDILSSRYSDLWKAGYIKEGQRPESWDLRLEGFDTILSSEGQEIKLFSSGQQSCPKPDWKILLTSGDLTKGYTWTLYGIA